MDLKLIPSSLILFRFLISPFLLWDAWDGKTSIWFLVGFVAAFISDIFDGIIARRLGVSTSNLRQADSWADVCLFISVFVSAWLAYQDMLIAEKLPLLIVIFSQLVWWIVPTQPRFGELLYL
jgi:phosphatidylglycerophosphate synthase